MLPIAAALSSRSCWASRRLIAPRAILFLTGDQDGGSPGAGIRKIESLVGGIYLLNGAEGRFESRVYPGLGHVYTQDMWERMLTWMDRYLREG